MRKFMAVATCSGILIATAVEAPAVRMKGATDALSK